MINATNIKNKIIQCIERGCHNFVIYPYGEDGLFVEECLNKYFGIIPVAIVDNTFCRFKEKILSGDELRKNYKSDWIVLLCVGSGSVSTQILDELLKYIDRKKIIQMSEEVILENNFKIENFLFNRQKKTKNKKFKFRVLYNTVSTWNVLATIVEECQKDEQIDVQVIVDGTQDLYGQDGITKRLQLLGVNYQRIESYFIEEDKPDVLILSHIFSNIRLGDPEIVRSSTRLIVVATISVVKYGNSILKFKKLLDNHFEKYQPDYYMVDTMIYREMKKCGVLTEKFVEMGNAKYDGIFKAYKNRDKIRYLNCWKKLRDKKKIITWILDHGIIEQLHNGSLHIQKDLTFDIFGKTFFTYARNHENIGFIFRPHSSLIKELLEFDLWSLNDVNIFKEWIYNSKNIIYDDSDDYNNALALADVLIADAHCGVIASAWPLGIPICTLYRNPIFSDNEPQLTKYYHRIDSPKYFANILNELIQNEITDYQHSKKNIHMFVKHFDGKNGVRIKNFLKRRCIVENGN